MTRYPSSKFLAETHTLSESRGETSDSDREASVFAETQTLTDARGEARDEDRRTSPLAETHTMTKASGEVNDSDPTNMPGTMHWTEGARSPLLFRNAVAGTGKGRTFLYDRELAMSVSENGMPLIRAHPVSETMTHSAARGEQDDSDQ